MKKKNAIRKTAFVPRIIFQTAFVSVIPACVLACGSDDSSQTTVTGDAGHDGGGSNTGSTGAYVAVTGFAVAATGFGVGVTGFTVAASGFTTGTSTGATGTNSATTTGDAGVDAPGDAAPEGSLDDATAGTTGSTGSTGLGVATTVAATGFTVGVTGFAVAAIGFDASRSPSGGALPGFMAPRQANSSTRARRPRRARAEAQAGRGRRGPKTQRPKRSA